MVIFLTGIFCPLLVETPKDTSNGNGVVTESSNNTIGTHWPSAQANVQPHFNYSQEP
jgi:hypothetical protein